MKKTLCFDDFYAEFQKNRLHNFSAEGLRVLFNYLEEFEQDTGEELELDVISLGEVSGGFVYRQYIINSLCCDFIEQSWQDVAESYDVDLSKCKDDEEKYKAVSVYIQENLGYVGEVSGGFVYRQYIINSLPF